MPKWQASAITVLAHSQMNDIRGAIAIISLDLRGYR